MGILSECCVVRQLGSDLASLCHLASLCLSPWLDVALRYLLESELVHWKVEKLVLQWAYRLDQPWGSV